MTIGRYRHEPQSRWCPRARIGPLSGGSARWDDPVRSWRRGDQGRTNGRRGDAQARADGAWPEHLLHCVQPRQEEHLPRYAHSARQGDLCRSGKDRGHRTGKLQAGYDEGHGLRIREAARAELWHHPGVCVGLRAIRPLHRPARIRSARSGDERADVADRPAGRPAAGNRVIRRGSLYRAARHDRRAGRAAASRSHGRGAAC